MQYVLITGAYGGMGKKAAEAFAEAGYGVFALDRKVGEPQKNVFPIEVDVTDMQSVQNAYTAVCERTNELFAILHFAGLYTLDSLVEIEEEEFVGAFDVNVFGVFRVNKTFLPLLKEGSRILITTSELAPLDPLPFTGLYAVTKSTLDKYAYSLRMELQLLGISVIVLRPGAVDTGMLGVSTAKLDAFCDTTKLYTCNAARFKGIVEKVEARKILPQKIAQKALKVVQKRKPKYVYAVNRNPLLLLLNFLPERMQTWIIKQILK